MIVAVDQNNAIGKGNTLPWRLPADLANFKALTTGKLIIMGRKTWESLGSKPLPNRTSLVLTRYPDTLEAGALSGGSVASVIKFAKNATDDEAFPEEVFIIGGGEVYHQFMPHVDRIYLSRVDVVVEGADAHFPEIDRDAFQLALSLRHTKDNEKNTYDWHYQIWDKVK